MLSVSDEISGIHYLPEIQIPNPANFGNIIMQDNNIPSSFHFDAASVFSNFFHTTTQIPPQGYDHHQLSSSLSNNSSTSDEAEEHVQQQLSNIIDQRKQRRMISNRESARRSRMRKQKHLDELCSQVLRLKTDKHDLIDRLNHVSESHDRVSEENAKLKEELLDLRKMINEIQRSSAP